MGNALDPLTRIREGVKGNYDPEIAAIDQSYFESHKEIARQYDKLDAPRVKAEMTAAGTHVVDTSDAGNPVAKDMERGLVRARLTSEITRLQEQLAGLEPEPEAK